MIFRQNPTVSFIKVLSTSTQLVPRGRLVYVLYLFRMNRFDHSREPALRPVQLQPRLDQPDRVRSARRDEP